MGRGVRDALARIGADTKGLDRALGRSRKAVNKWGRGVQKSLRRSLKGAFGSLKNIAGFGSVAGLALAGRDVLSFEKRLTRLGIQANKGAAPMANLRKEIFDISRATGVDAGDLLSGVEKFVSLTGEFDQASGSMATFAKVAAASGAAMGDISTTAAAMSTNMGLTAGEMEQAFSILLSQGKAGAIELKDMAQLAAGLTPTFEKFGSKGINSLAEMGALLQVVRGGFGTSQEAATGLQSLMTAMLKNQKRFKGAGVDIFKAGSTTELRGVTDILFDLLEKTKGDPARLTKILGRVEGLKAILPLLKQGRGEVERLVTLGKESNAVQEDSQKFLESNAGKISKAMASIKATINATLVKHVDDIVIALKGMAKALSFVVKGASALSDLFSDESVDDFQIGLLRIREAAGLVAPGTTKSILGKRKAGVKATDIVRLPSGQEVEARVAEELGFQFGGVEKPKSDVEIGEPVFESSPLSSGGSFPQAPNPFGPVPLSPIEKLAQQSDTTVEIGDAVIDLSDTIKKGIPVNISIVDGNLSAGVANDPGSRRDGR